MLRKTTVTVIIPAYNEAENIQRLLIELLRQKTDSFELQEIVVINDKSKDKTAKLTEEIGSQNNIIKLVSNKKRLGKAKSIKKVMEKADQDILVVLDADISVANNDFIQKLIEPICSGRADLTSTLQNALTPKSFFEKLLYISTLIKEDMYTSLDSGNNIYMCHGHSRAFSKRLYKSMKLDTEYGEDAHSYFSCILRGYNFILVTDAVAFYKLPDNYKDHFNQSTRFFKSKKLLENRFGKSVVSQSYRIPLSIVIKSGMKYGLRYPIHVTTYFIVMVSAKFAANLVKMTKTWEMAGSTKKLGGYL